MKLQKIGFLAAGVGLTMGMMAAATGAGASSPQPSIHLRFFGGTNVSGVPAGVDGQEVTVTGKNFVPNAPLVAVAECNPGIQLKDANACIQTPGFAPGDVVLTTTSATGTMKVRNFYVVLNEAAGVGDGTCNTGQTCFITVAVLNPSNPTGTPEQLALFPFVVLPGGGPA
jgi:hypothetical protein